jgi:hypothetical protein
VRDGEAMKMWSSMPSWHNSMIESTS